MFLMVLKTTYIQLIMSDTIPNTTPRHKRSETFRLNENVIKWINNDEKHLVNEYFEYQNLCFWQKIKKKFLEMKTQKR